MFYLSEVKRGRPIPGINSHESTALFKKHDRWLAGNDTWDTTTSLYLSKKWKICEMQKFILKYKNKIQV